MMSVYAVYAFFLQFFGYFFLSGTLECLFYKSNNNNKKKEWKIQPNERTHGIISKSRTRLSIPLLDFFFGMSKHDVESKKRHPMHAIFGTINLTCSSLFSAIVTELTIRGKSNIILNNNNDNNAFEIIRCLFLALGLQSLLEYPWHRLMHTRFFYRRFHKIHHEYKSPCVYCDLFIHPMEAIGYYCILYSPAFLITDIPKEAFLMYIVLLGIFGVFDHSGVAIKLPWFMFNYDSKFHDLHHKLFHVNYAFPFQFPDLIFGTLSRVS